MTALFLFNNILLGVGLAMDAFSVSIANGLEDPGMSKRRMSIIAGCYGFFQWLMPMTGWLCVHTVASYFTYFQRFIPWIALILLCWIGGKMVIEGIRKVSSKKVEKVEAEEERAEAKAEAAGKHLGYGELLVQGIATSIDALSVGFTIAEYGTGEALLASVIIAVVTFGICMSGLLFGKKFGEKLADKATLVGGLILIGIGIEIFVTGIA